jgi:hypothetical protein
MKKVAVVVFSLIAILAVLGAVDAVAAAFPPALGGTGTTATPLPGQVLIGTGSASYTPAYILCAGACQVATSSGGITITGTGVATNTGNWAGTWQLYNPRDFVPSSTQIVNTVNGGSGTVTITSSTLGVIWPTVNGNKATNYNITATNGVTSTVSGATTTISVSLNNGSAVTCSANQFLNTISATGTAQCGSITFPTIPTYTFAAGTGLSESQATSTTNTTTTYTNTGVTSFTGTGCVTAANSTGTVALTVTCISGNQSITFTISGDATGTASGATAITDSITVTGLNGKALPANTTGTLQFSGGAWKINIATSSLGVYDASGNVSSYLGSSCGGGQFVTGFSATGTVACGTPGGSGTVSAATTTYVAIYCGTTTVCGYADVVISTSTNTMTINGTYPLIAVKNTSASQYSGSGLNLYNGVTSTGQGGYTLYSGVNDAGDSQSFFALNSINATGTANGNIIGATGTSTVTLYPTVQINGTNLQLTQDSNGDLQVQNTGGSGNGEQTILNIQAPAATPQEADLTLSRGNASGSIAWDFSNQCYGTSTMLQPSNCAVPYFDEIQWKSTSTLNFEPLRIGFWTNYSNPNLSEATNTTFIEQLNPAGTVAIGPFASTTGGPVYPTSSALDILTTSGQANALDIFNGSTLEAYINALGGIVGTNLTVYVNGSGNQYFGISNDGSGGIETYCYSSSFCPWEVDGAPVNLDTRAPGTVNIGSNSNIDTTNVYGPLNQSSGTAQFASSTFNGSLMLNQYKSFTCVGTNSSGNPTNVSCLTSVATGTDSIYYVAASNAPQSQKNIAQYICTSTTDDTCVQSAITAASTTGGTIDMSNGTFGYQVNGVATSVKEFSNNIVIEGQGAGTTNWTSAVTSTPIIQIGTRQTGGGLLTNVGLTGINFTCANATSTIACVKVDGLGNGSFIENNSVNYGGYCYQLEDLDRPLIFNDICNNPYIAAYYGEEGLENTYGNVNFQNDTAALSNASSVAWLFGADADQGSPAAIARITMLNDLFHSNNGVASTTGLQMTVPSRAMTVQNSLFESNTWQVNLDSEDHVDFIADQMTNNNPFSATSSVDCFEFDNLGGGNPWVTIQDDSFDNCVNGFHSYSGTYPWLTFLGTNKNDSNITNLFVGSWSALQGQDTNFAGGDVLNLGLSTQPMANVFTVNLTATGTIQTGLANNSFVATNGSGQLITTSTPSGGGGGAATTTPYVVGGMTMVSSTGALSTEPIQQWYSPYTSNGVNNGSVNLWGANTDILTGPVIIENPIQADAIMWYTRTTDASTTDKYDIGLYKINSNTSTVATLVFNAGANTLVNGGKQIATSTQGSVLLQPGEYLIGITGSSTTGKMAASGNEFYLWNAATGNASVGGVLSATTTVPAMSPDNSPYPQFAIFNR